MKLAGILLLMATLGLAGCGGSHTPSAPSAPSRPVAVDEDSYIKGTVRDTAFRPLAGARVEVLDGPLAGTSTTANSDGEFTFIGTFEGSPRFRATLADHVPATATLAPRCEPCRPHRWVYLELGVLTPPVGIAGDYTVTFTVADACKVFPPEFRTHSFAASLTPTPSGSDTSFSIIPIGPSFEGLQTAWAGVAGNDVNFGFGDPGIIEEVAEHVYLSFYGGGVTHVAASDPSTISVPFDGWIVYCALPADKEFDYSSCAPFTVPTSCVSKNQQLVLTRR